MFEFNGSEIREGDGVIDGARTHDNWNHNPSIYNNIKSNIVLVFSLFYNPTTEFRRQNGDTHGNF